MRFSISVLAASLLAVSSSFAHAAAVPSEGPSSAPLQRRLTSSLKRETSFSGQPSNAIMYTYVPTTYKKGNPLVLALHHCQGTGPSYFG